MTTSTNNPAGQYAAVNGINLYYEMHGTGRPLIMLHGGFGTFEMFTALAPTLAQNHQVIGVDLYGHGRTALTDRPIHFEHMADDIAGLIGHLGLETADLLGYSLGGAVALQTAIRHPARVNALVVISIPFKVIWVWPLGEGFVIALTYGVLVDWYRNRLSSSHQKQESTSDSSPWFKNGSVSALANCRQILFTQKENRQEKSDCLRVRVIGRGRGKPRMDLSIRERRTGAV